MPTLTRKHARVFRRAAQEMYVKEHPDGCCFAIIEQGYTYYGFRHWLTTFDDQCYRSRQEAINIFSSVYENDAQAAGFYGYYWPKGEEYREARVLALLLCAEMIENP